MKPLYSLRVGAVEGAVFVNQQEGNSIPWYSTRIVNHYKDSAGNWATNSNFDSRDLANVSKVAECCNNFIISKVRRVETVG